METAHMNSIQSQKLHRDLSTSNSKNRESTKNQCCHEVYNGKPCTTHCAEFGCCRRCREVAKQVILRCNFSGGKFSGKHQYGQHISRKLPISLVEIIQHFFRFRKDIEIVGLNYMNEKKSFFKEFYSLYGRLHLIMI